MAPFLRRPLWWKELQLLTVIDGPQELLQLGEEEAEWLFLTCKMKRPSGNTG